jgi:hypothetical protein
MNFARRVTSTLFSARTALRLAGEMEHLRCWNLVRAVARTPAAVRLACAIAAVVLGWAKGGSASYLD